MNLHLKNLHWHKINERIEYKIALMMYKCVNNLAPKFLGDLGITHHHRHLRSTTFDLLPPQEAEPRKFIKHCSNHKDLEYGTLYLIT